MRENEIDPIKQCLDAIEEDKINTGNDNKSSGLIVFFHGSPCEGKLGIFPKCSYDKYMYICFIKVYCNKYLIRIYFQKYMLTKWLTP